MTQQKFHIPLLSEVRVKTAHMPLHLVFWKSIFPIGFGIRQALATPLTEDGLGLTTLQRESIRRGVLTIWGKLGASYLLDPKRNGTEEWLRKVVSTINLAIKGSKPINHLQLCRCSKTRFLAYYAPFYSNYLEFVLYIDDGSDIDEATVIHLPRSYVDESTRDWKRLAEQLPLEIWIKEAQA